MAATVALFDCDGTLFLGDDELSARAMLEALRRLTGAALPESALEELDHEAQPARWLAAELVRRHGLREIDLAHRADLVEELSLARIDPSDAETWTAPPGAAEALDELVTRGFRIALVTGVPKRIARHRMLALGLDRHFAATGQGAFGSEVDDRDALLRLALERAGAEAGDAIHVGDTARDVQSACAVGIRVCLVAFDGSPVPDDVAPDAVAHSMADVVHELVRLRASSLATA